MENNSIKSAKNILKKEMMPSSLKAEFCKHGMEDELEKVYIRTAELIEDNQHASKALKTHLAQILPCIAFYEILIEKEGSKDKALSIYGDWALLKIEKVAKVIPKIMKFPGLYKTMPKLFDLMLDKLFGAAAGFESKTVPEMSGQKVFARDMIVCPYVETCKKYNCLEIAQFFCKSDDIIYGNMHPKLLWGRTKTLGTGGDCCDFRLYIKSE